MQYLLLEQTLMFENILQPLIKVFGWIMDGIMIVLDQVGIHSIALCIVLFTIITKLLLLPLTIKQQKSARLQSVVSPELQAIQKKYAGMRDPASQQKMMEEHRAVQEKYGVSTFSGCLPTLIQMPILFALYPVIYKMETYVSHLTVLKERFTDSAGNIMAEYTRMWQLFDLDLKSAPKEAPGFPLAWPIIIPLLVAGAQYLQTKLIMSRQTMPNTDNPMVSSMKVMNLISPLMIGFMAIQFPAFLGIYWGVQALVMMVQQILINKHLDKKSLEEMIQESREKANKKRAKKGLPPISEKATISTRNIGRPEPEVDQQKKEQKIKESTEYYANRSTAPGSLAAKANMVRDYNERNNKK